MNPSDPRHEDFDDICIWSARTSANPVPASLCPSRSREDDAVVNPMIPAGLPAGPDTPFKPAGPGDEPPPPPYGVALRHQPQRPTGFMQTPATAESETMRSGTPTSR